MFMPSMCSMMYWVLGCFNEQQQQQQKNTDKNSNLWNLHSMLNLPLKLARLNIILGAGIVSGSYPYSSDKSDKQFLAAPKNII